MYKYATLDISVGLLSGNGTSGIVSTTSHWEEIFDINLQTLKVVTCSYISVIQTAAQVNRKRKILSAQDVSSSVRMWSKLSAE